MLESVKEEAVRLVFNAEVAVPETPAATVGVAPQSAAALLAALPKAEGAEAEGAAEVEAAAAAEAAQHVGEEVEPEKVVAGVAAAAGGAAPAVEIRAAGVQTGPRREQLHYSAPDETGGVSERDVTALHGGKADLSDEQMEGVGKNAPCPCGSGKKFKMCHGKERAKAGR
jgi:preprotein translocase subunit SecA